MSVYVSFIVHSLSLEVKLEDHRSGCFFRNQLIIKLSWHQHQQQLCPFELTFEQLEV